MQNNLVSVIIPTHNRADLLPETIKSALAQTYENIEIIVVDNGSTDNTGEVIAKMKVASLRYYRQENSGGPAGPRNTGYKMSKGEYVAFLDSDDLWLADKITRQVEVLKNKPETGLVFSQCRFFGENYHQNIIYPSKAYSGNVFEKLITGNFVPTVSVLCRRETLEKSGVFDENPNLRAFEDYELWMRIAHKFQFHYIAEPLCLFRVHPQNFLGMNNLKSHLGAFRALCSVINKIDFSEEHLKLAVAHHYLTTAMSFLEIENFDNFEKFIKRSIAYKPGPLAAAIYSLKLIIGNKLLYRLYSLYRSQRH
jgi:glycosyltransferase involved in cell wall biosynthesis